MGSPIGTNRVILPPSKNTPTLCNNFYKRTSSSVLKTLHLSKIKTNLFQGLCHPNKKQVGKQNQPQDHNSAIGHMFYTLINSCALKSVFNRIYLQTLDTVGNGQRLLFTVGVAQHMHKITNL